MHTFKGLCGLCLHWRRRGAAPPRCRCIFLVLLCACVPLLLAPIAGRNPVREKDCHKRCGRNGAAMLLALRIWVHSRCTRASCSSPLLTSSSSTRTRIIPAVDARKRFQTGFRVDVDGQSSAPGHATQPEAGKLACRELRKRKPQVWCRGQFP
jgi:hypothetical protein